MHMVMKKTVLALGLGSSALLAQAQIPAHCQRISGEETGVAPDGYAADGTPVFCAKAPGGFEASTQSTLPAAPSGYGTHGGTAAPQASGGWNGRLNTPLPGSQKQGGFGAGGGASGSLGGSFQGRVSQGAPGSGVTQSLGQNSRYGQGAQAGYGQTQPPYGQGQAGYGQGQFGDSPSQTGRAGYGADAGPSGGGYDPYAGQAGASGAYDPGATASMPQGSDGSGAASPHGDDPYAGVSAGSSGNPPPGSDDPYAGQPPLGRPSGDDPDITLPSGDPRAQADDNSGSVRGAGRRAAGAGGINLPTPLGDRLPPAGQNAVVMPSSGVPANTVVKPPRVHEISPSIPKPPPAGRLVIRPPGG